MHDYKHLRRSTDNPFAPKRERLALLVCVGLTVLTTLSFLIILADSL